MDEGKLGSNGSKKFLKRFRNVSIKSSRKTASLNFCSWKLGEFECRGQNFIQTTVVKVIALQISR